MSRNWLRFTPGNLPVVSVRIGFRRYFALVDTGAYINLALSDLSLKLGLPQEKAQNIVALNGQVEAVPTVLLPAIGFGNVELAPCRAGLRNLKPLGLGIELLLGVNAFAQHRLQFDFREGRIYIVE